jgi:signal transduction histidine kinase
VGKGLELSVGRVIAIGRLLLATLFTLAISMNLSPQPGGISTAQMLLAAYLLFAAGVALFTWTNWALDAKLAGLAHAIDIGLFTLLVPLADGYTSPFVSAFTFILLAAAIRWGWRATALTAVLLILLYLGASLVAVMQRAGVDPSLIVIRTGHLVILSLILVWFGANQGASGRNAGFLVRPSLGDRPIESGLRAAMASVGARVGVLVRRDQPSGEVTGLAIRGGSVAALDASALGAADVRPGTAFLYSLARDECLSRDENRNLVAGSARDAVPAAVAAALGSSDGLAVPFETDGWRGKLYLGRIPHLAADHIDLAPGIASSIIAHFQSHELLTVAEENAEARSRLTLARDLHDSVVQFLAGAAFRLEAIKRAGLANNGFEAELDDLKQLMLQEQRELRAFIAALRSGPTIDLGEIEKDLQALAERLSRQWTVACTFTGCSERRTVPTRIRLDAQQLVKEAVANAARHAKATSVSIALKSAPDAIFLEIINDGAEFPLQRGQADMPISLTERVHQEGGTIDVARGMGVTRMSISLPIAGTGR